MPPALFVVGTRDPLQEDRKLMYAQWSSSNGNAELIIVPEAPHGFNFQGTSAARKPNDYVQSWIGQKLSLADISG